VPFTYPSPESTLPDIEITWYDDAGNLIDMTAATFLVQVSLSDDLSASLITKAAGITGAATAPNMTVQWSAGELSVLSSGRWYFHATATVGGVVYTMSDFLYIEGDTIRLGPCETWVTASDLQDCAAQLPAGAEACDLQLAAQYATENLWRFSGRQYGGLCVDRVRPCIGVNCLYDGVVTLDGLSNGYRYSYPSIPTRRSGEWRNIPLCAGGRCHLPCIVLPGPVHSILQVLVDGVVLDPSRYEIAGHRQLCRTDGDKWPCHQDMSLDATETGTFEVTWTRGTPVPDVAKRMARIYALRRLLPMICEANDCNPAAENVEIMSADGVTVDFLDTNDETRHMRTGIPVVDEWLNSVNPYKRTRRARVYRADNPARASRKFT
jgi:hypothetical protein